MKDDLSEAYPKLQKKEYSSLSKMFIATDDSFIFILDEWDSVFCKNFMKNDDKNSYFEFLKGLLKDQPYAELVYMTGVLPIAKYSSGSELNMFDEFHFMNDNIFDLYFGFNEDEVQELCELHPTISYDEMKTWYDGYYLSDGRSLFNPRSVCKALERGICLNYWTETGPMNEIADFIEYNVDEVREDIVKMVAGMQVETDLMGYSAAEQQMNTRDENSLSCVITLCYLAARKDYIIEREMASGKGFCDYLFIPKNPQKTAIVMELKYGYNAEAAIQQIKDKNYMQKIDNYNEILFVGISYDKTKHHSCRIEHITRAIS